MKTQMRTKKVVPSTPDIASELKKLAEIPGETEKELGIQRLSKELGVPKKTIRSEIQTIIRSELTDTKAEEDEKFTDDERNKAISLLKSPDLLEKFLEMTERVGIVKEEINKLCLYLSYTSRKLNEPISIVVRGQSSSGKSYLSNTILEKFIPKGEYFTYSRITPQSLLYMRDKTLAHKTLVVYEASGSKKADYNLRTFISEKVLKVLHTTNDPNTGEFVSKEVIIKGPIQYVSTTTQSNMHPENYTRVFALYVDESPEKIYASLNATAAKHTGNQDKEELNAELKIWRCLQTLLLCQKVHIPFAPFLVSCFPTDTTRTQRDFPRFLSLIEASALLHQYQRDKEGDAIIASIEDYEHARKVGEVVLAQTVKGISKFSEKLLGVIKTEFHSSTFTREDLKEQIGWNDQKVRRSVEDLVKSGYICKTSSIIPEQRQLEFPNCR